MSVFVVVQVCGVSWTVVLLEREVGPIPRGRHLGSQSHKASLLNPKTNPDPICRPLPIPVSLALGHHQVFPLRIRTTLPAVKILPVLRTLFEI